MKARDKKELLKKIGGNIKRIRRSKRVEVKELATNIGISAQAIGKIENGNVDLNFSRIIDIANALGVNYSDILNLKPENQSFIDISDVINDDEFIDLVQKMAERLRVK